MPFFFHLFKSERLQTPSAISPPQTPARAFSLARPTWLLRVDWHDAQMEHWASEEVQLQISSPSTGQALCPSKWPCWGWCGFWGVGGGFLGSGFSLESNLYVLNSQVENTCCLICCRFEGRFFFVSSRR